jgi:hypothetical protein
VLNQVIGELLDGHPVSDVKLKEVLGHTPLQVGREGKGHRDWLRQAGTQLAMLRRPCCAFQDLPLQQRPTGTGGYVTRGVEGGSCALFCKVAMSSMLAQHCSRQMLIIIPCKPYLSASATAPHPLGRRKVERLFSLFSV